ncbi:MAG TPA: K(+)-transporting ATPase subunit F [Burkholderiaceae bacterium]|nr:K(+)-transporting ATPase subunit F [Burkholderiaceae bacterium]
MSPMILVGILVSLGLLVYLLVALLYPEKFS